MKKLLRHFYLLLFLSVCFFPSAQTVNTIKVKKSSNVFYFYQKGIKKDTISKTEGNLFYLIASDSLKKHLSISVENGQLLKTANDSLYLFKYVKGMKYECVFKPVNKQANILSFEFKTLVNGVSQLSSNTIIISVTTESGKKPVLEDKFYFRE